jgi:hypothetical protein
MGRSSGKRRTKQGQWLRPTTRLAIYLRDDWTCAWCGRKAGPYQQPPKVVLTVDHIVPAAEGGTNAPQNLVTSCWICNCTRRESSADEFRAWLEWRGVDVLPVDHRLQKRFLDLNAFRPWARALHKEAPAWLRLYRRHAKTGGRETYASRFGPEPLSFSTQPDVVPPHIAEYDESLGGF